MPTARPKPCRHPGCKQLVKDEAYCAEHKKVQRQIEDRDRATAAQRGYDSRWRKASKTFLSRHPLCQACEVKGKVTAAAATDHKVPHRLFDALESGDEAWIAQAQHLFWDTSNWQAICPSCHSVKTNREDGGFGRARRQAGDA